MTFSLFEPSSPEAKLCFLGPVTHSLLDTMREALKNQTQKSALIRAAIFSRYHALNRYLFELLRRIGEGARRLASTITSSGGTRLRDITLVHVEIEAITNALEAFKSEVAGGASGGTFPGRLIKE
jgi:hypothetical protein